MGTTLGPPPPDDIAKGTLVWARWLKQVWDTVRGTSDLAPSLGTVANTKGAQTLENKSISGASNTLSAVPQSALTGVVYARHTMTGAISIPASSTPKGLDYQTQGYDSHSAVTHPGSVWRFTAPTGHGGLYALNARCLIQMGGVNASVEFYIRVGGTDWSIYIDERNTWTGWCQAHIPGMVYLNAGQYVEVWMGQSSGGARNTWADGRYSFVEILKVSA